MIDNNAKYPNPYPVGDVSKIFCEAVVRGAREKYETLNEKGIAIIFKESNDEVGRYNKKIGKSDISGNTTNYYSAIGSFMVIKDNKAY